MSRLRGHQTLKRLRKSGLTAPGPVYIAARTFIDDGFAWAVTIGAHTTISSDVRIVAHDAAIKHLTGYTEIRPVVIGAYCYIGMGAIILPGASVGDNAVVGAGSLVRGEIPAGTVAVGNPARVIARVDDLAQRHLAHISSNPPFEGDPRDFSPDEISRLQQTLRERGRAYVR
jgi:maltose O-acetyltransferase